MFFRIFIILTIFAFNASSVYAVYLPKDWSQCYNSPSPSSPVAANAAINDAAAKINEIARLYGENFDLHYVSKDNISTQSQISALDKINSSIILAFGDASQAITMADEVLSKKSLEMEMEFLKLLSQQGIQEEMDGFFSDNIGGLNRPMTANSTSTNENKSSSSYVFFKSMCKRNKMVSKMNNTDFALDKNQKINNQATKKTNSVVRVSNSNLNSIKKLDVYYENYCNAYDIANNLCS